MKGKEIKISEVEYTYEFKQKLDRRFADYKSGKTKMITEEESKDRIHKILNRGKKNNQGA